MGNVSSNNHSGQNTIKKIVFIGAGNVASHLAKALSKSGKTVVQVYSRTAKSAQSLADKLKCCYTTSIADLTSGADLYIFCVPDDALEGCIADFPHQNKLMVHTAGSIEMGILANKSNRIGVIYPLQTFSRDVDIDFRAIPLCLESNNRHDGDRLQEIASGITGIIYKIDSPTRQLLHIAAVFACNFTNHLLDHADRILKQGAIPYQILLPLINETIRKTTLGPPSGFQTGPAVRGDKKTVNKHIVNLELLPESQKLYTFISESIINLHRDKI